ncbi:MAG: hypothetical protein WA412_11705 [Candidatus Sulfotelmatobacter sp.]
MKLAITRFVIVAAIAVLMVAVGSTAAWAQTPCPSSPNYSPDFSSNQSCLTPNDNASPFPILFDGNNVLQLTSSTSNQIGAAWYNTPQPVENGFTTSFQFQFTGASTPPADGIAFVIQNSTSKLNAIGFTGGNGGAIGYGDDDNNLNPSTGEGIPNSLAIEFDTYQNGWDPASNGNGSDSHVAIQSCGSGPNTSHHGYLCAGTTGSNSTVGAPVVTSTNMADGAVHSVTITYVAAVPGALANIQVTLDGANIFPSPVIADLSTIELGTGGTAYVGFTGATGGDFEAQDILNWVFTPTVQGTPINTSNPSTLSQSVSVTLPTNTLTAGFSFPPANVVVAPGTVPYFGFSGMTQPQYAALVSGTAPGTALGGTTCLTAVGLTDSNGNRECVVNSFTATTSANPVQSGANLPQVPITETDTLYTRDTLFSQQFNLDTDTQGPLLMLTGGVLTIPPGTAPGIAEFNDSATCPFPTDDPLYGQACPRSIMTSVIDGPTKPSGTPKPAGSSQVFFCCEAEWTAAPTIPLWTNQTTGIPVSFANSPPYYGPASPPYPASPLYPATPPTGFQAAQGLGVSFGAVAASAAPPDPVLSFPTETTVINSTPCPGSWSSQVPATFTVTGMLTQYDNAGGAAIGFPEGAYTLLYAPLDCDEFLGLKYPASINLGGTPVNLNLASWNTAPFNVDLTNPGIGLITLSPATPGSYYAVGATVNASMTCTDPIGHGVASGIASCGGTLVTPSNGTGPGSFTASASVPTGTTGLHSFNFTAGATDVAGNLSGAPAAVPYTVVGNADLAIGMLGGLIAKTGQTVTYVIGVANAGPSTAEEVTVVDTVPSYTTAVSATFAVGSCTLSGTPSCSVTTKTPCAISGGVITCSIGALSAWTKGNPTGAGIQVTVKVNASVPTNTKITNSVAVSGVANADPNLKNNTATWPTIVTN